MRIRLLAAGTRMPAWVQAGFQEYAARLPRECRLELEEIALGRRTRKLPPATAVQREGERMLQRAGEHDRIIALDVRGRQFATAELATQLAAWLEDRRDITLLVGGPDGLAPACLQRAELRWSLSALTLPHGMVRVLVAEQLYRAWSILRGHPYHRGP